eukprot:scaffold41831_cov73-Phaeocystis_antarctica.AAC.9
MPQRPRPTKRMISPRLPLVAARAAFISSIRAAHSDSKAGCSPKRLHRNGRGRGLRRVTNLFTSEDTPSSAAVNLAPGVCGVLRSRLPRSSSTKSLLSWHRGCGELLV